jgi:hypothetical protein
MSPKKGQPPFIPPIRGCRVDRIHHLGPFITRVDFKLPDGTPYVWTSRRHRWLGGLRDPSKVGSSGAIEPSRWWLEVGALARIGWWIAALFMSGSTCFAVASAAGLSPSLFGDFARNPTAINFVFFAGSVFFTLAAWLQLLAAVNSDRIAAIAHRVPLQGRLAWFAWKPRQIGWLSAFVQFVGTLLFNVNTIDALLPSLDWLQEDLLIWAPDVFGSVCFLVASSLAMIEYAHAEGRWNPADVSWWIVSVNLMGSVAFGVSAVYAVFVPGTGELLDARAVGAYTCLGALGFFAGAYLLLPELGRNVRRVVHGDSTAG